MLLQPRFSDTHNVISPEVNIQAHVEGSGDANSSSCYSSSDDQDTTMVASSTLMDNAMASQIDSQLVGSHDSMLTVTTSFQVGAVTLTDSTLLLPDLSTVTIPTVTSQLLSINSSSLLTPSMAHMTADFDLTTDFTPSLTFSPTVTATTISVTPLAGGDKSGGPLTVEEVSLSSSSSTSKSSLSSSGSSSGDLLPTSGLTIGGGLAATSGLTIERGLVAASDLTIGGGLEATSGLTTMGSLSSSSSLIGGSFVPSGGSTVGGGLLSSGGLTIGGGLSSKSSSASITVGGLLPSNGLITGGGLSSSSSLTIGGGLLSNSGLTIGRGLLSSKSLTTGGGLLSSTGRGSSLTIGNVPTTAREGLSTTSVTISSLLSNSNLSTSGGLLSSSNLATSGGLLSSSNLATGGGLLSSSNSTGLLSATSGTLSTGGGLLSTGGLTTGGGLLSTGGLTTGGGLLSTGGLITKGGLLSSSGLTALSSWQTIDTNLQSGVSLTSNFMLGSGLTSHGGLTSGGSLTSTSPTFKHETPFIKTSSLLTSSGLSLGSGLTPSSGLVAAKSTPAIGSDYHINSALITSSGYSLSSGLLTAGGLKLSSDLPLSTTSGASEHPHSITTSTVTTSSTVEWPSHVQAILDSTAFDVNKFLSSLQMNNKQLTEVTSSSDVLPTAIVSKSSDDVVGGVVMSSVSSSSASSVEEDDATSDSSDDDQSVVSDHVTSHDPLINVVGTLITTPIPVSTKGLSIPSLTTTITTLSSSIITSPLHYAPPSSTHLSTVTQLSSSLTASLHTSPPAKSLYNNYSLQPLSSTHGSSAGESRPQSSLYPFTTAITMVTTPTHIVSKSASSLTSLSLEDLERGTSTPKLSDNLLPLATHGRSILSTSSFATSVGGDIDTLATSHLLSTSKSAPFSSKYCTPSLFLTTAPSIHTSPLITTVPLSTPNVCRQIFPSSSGGLNDTPSISRRSVSLVYSSASKVTFSSSASVKEEEDVKQLKALHTPSSVTLSKPCCVGDSVQTLIPITNSCERWIQCKAQVIQLYRDTKQVL